MTPGSRLVGPHERALYLKSLPSWHALPPSELAIVAERVGERTVPAGTRLLEPEGVTDFAYLVVEGRVALRREGQPDRMLGPRDRFGLLSLLSQTAPGYAAVVEEESLLLSLDLQAIREIYEESFVVYRADVGRLAGIALDLITTLPTFTRVIPPLELPTLGSSGSFDLVDRVLLLHRAPPFRQSSPVALGELARGFEEIRIPPGTRVWSNGARATFLLMLIEGELECAPEVRPAFVMGRPGSTIGFLEGLAGRPRWFDATTRTEIHALRHETETFLDVLEDSFDTAFDYIANLAGMAARLMTEAVRTGVYEQVAQGDRTGPYAEYLPPEPSAS